MRNAAVALALCLLVMGGARPRLERPAAACDSLAVHRLEVRVRFAQDRALHYAAIVARDPSQARFLDGWMRRAFKDVLQAGR